jgi:sigma-B regulation protein RsbU (phosphoserine phosphatase)
MSKNKGVERILKLRTKILLSYILLIAILVCGIYAFFDIYAINELTNKHIKLAEDSVGDISRMNRKLSRQTLGELGRTILELVTERSAMRAAVYLNAKGDAYMHDYEKLRKDKKFRSMVTHPVYIYGEQAGFADLFDDTGKAVMHVNPEIEGKNYKIWREKYPQMWNLVRKSFTEMSVSGKYEFIDEKGQPCEKFMVICQIPGTPFRLATAVQINRYFDPIHEKIAESERNFTNLINSGMVSSSREASRKIRLWSIPFIAFVTLLCMLFGLWFSASIAAPLKRLISVIGELGGGNFTTSIPEDGTYETVQLAQTFNQLGGKLMGYIQSLKNETEARQSVESEIKIARNIQSSLLPKNFPKSEWFNTYSRLEPAKEVAGDFYDTFIVKDRLIMIVGDVSGKGVPAAFFMAVVRTLLRDLCHNFDDPGRILTRANNILCEENENCMFVTLLLCIYDINTGDMRFANAGHNEILRLKNDGTFANFGFTGNMAMGIVPDSDYRTVSENIKPGDLLVMYTDGITEAISSEQVLYGIEKLSELVSGAGSEVDPERLCSMIVDDVLEYESGNRFDDITVTVFKKY